jgi:hypothetical protein
LVTVAALTVIDRADHVVIGHDDVRSAAVDHEVRRDQPFAAHGTRLQVDLALDQSHARKRTRGFPRHAHERRSVHDGGDVHRDGIRDALRIRAHNHHFPGRKEKRVAERAVNRQPQAALEDQHLEQLPGDMLEHDGGAGNGSSDRRGADLGAAQPLRYL